PSPHQCLIRAESVPIAIRWRQVKRTSLYITPAKEELTMATDGQNEAATIEKLNNGPTGAAGAYSRLKADYDNYASSHTADASKLYWNDVTQKLTDDRVLPAIAVGWAKQDGVHDLDPDGNKLTAFDLNQPKHWDPNNPSNLPDITFSQALKDNSSLTAGSDGTYTTKSFDDFLTAQTNKNASDEHDERAKLSGLFQDPSLLKTLDSAKNGQYDGQISRDDMKKFLDDFNGGKRDGSYSFDNYKLVSDIYYNNGSVKYDELTKGFKVNDLADKGGFDTVDIKKADDYARLIANYQSAESSYKGATATGGSSSGGKT
ncbi:MAG: hypothetical protein ACRD3W_10800, partial [Terriglobales bacterium]